MKHADVLIKRILMLDGLPNLQSLNKLLIGENVPEALGGDLTLEKGSLIELKTSIAYCESVSDFVTRELLREILDATEEHVDWLETQLELIEKIGVHNYLQSQVGEST